MRHQSWISLNVFLRRRVLELYTAAKDKIGLEMFQQHNPDIVVTGIDMPEMNGLDMSEIIRKTDPDVPIVVIIAYNDQDYFIRAIEMGIDKYVLKPVETERLLNTLFDVAEKLNAKRELEAVRKNFENSMRLECVAQLTKGMAHNFNNILVGILGYAGLIRMKLSDSQTDEKDELLKYIDTIEKSADCVAGLIKHLMTFSVKTRFEKRNISINDAVEHALQLFMPFLPENITIETVFSEKPLPVKCDKDKIAQAIVNICVNAVEAMPEGGNIKLETLEEGNHGVIKITDSGAGMDEDTARRIFEPFFTTKGLTTHLGLELSTSHSIVREHGGFIKVEIGHGAGSEFKIYLPILRG